MTTALLSYTTSGDTTTMICSIAIEGEPDGKERYAVFAEMPRVGESVLLPDEDFMLVFKVVHFAVDLTEKGFAPTPTTRVFLRPDPYELDDR